ncbi:ABC transporter ATP-binding protein [Chloracidobacterium aggregatum]|uniref:ABC transporter ATP-binding protein n=1 Tax=Chloracidobacterium sp. N TaxID=2821540 RepID=A0ABX8AYJ3_9BACT|nr:ABC transporter ATP-binding protein [Chloracidobacterium aggregatum]QUV84339.1 ABC transporter ATP-binding protein [Chloracidobacterium sp. 2]QUV87176.1 ABC transporter ATP-binding protein [Chloracidobacterium sp. S]QUV90077.1 ABC transporter ATP-binding protein [Chloracidobacterium sp. A]QUV93288.1 ABC transporter ATP-binding protein [Chloracidobacterium sp. N]QUV96446.1 ABC transporter ATP-binding protein [Chloracidobacterium sp. E]
MIELKQLSKQALSGQSRLTILHPLDLVIPAGQFAAILGPSGSGKSTLLGLMAGLDTPTTGEVILAGTSITRLGEDALAAFRSRTIGFVFQAFHLIPTATALENIQIPMEIAGRRDARKRAKALLAAVGLSARGHHYPAQLSGGEQQRVAIARAFANEPPILLADEPTGNLDYANGMRIFELLRELNQSTGTTLVLVTHNEELARAADRAITLRDGRIVLDNPKLSIEPLPST